MGRTASGIEIRAASSADLPAVYAFRYGIYVEEMGRPQRAADHVSRTIKDDLDQHSVNLAAFEGDRIAGVVRVNFASESQARFYEDFYQMSGVGAEHPLRTAIVTRLMVAPALRRTSLAARLCTECYRIALMRGTTWGFMDCNEHLIPFFERMAVRGCV